MKTKIKVLLVVIVLTAVTSVLSVLTFIITKNNTSMQTENKNETSTVQPTAQDIVSTVDEADIKKLEMELQKYKSANNDTEKKIKEVASKYINIRYNTGKSADKILKEVKPYVSNSYINQIEISLNKSAGNFMQTNKIVDNYCTPDDIYITSDTYDDGSKLYMTACICKVSDEYIRYHQISFTQYEDGTYLINNDNTHGISYSTYELNLQEPTVSKKTS